MESRIVQWKARTRCDGKLIITISKAISDTISVKFMSKYAAKL